MNIVDIISKMPWYIEHTWLMSFGAGGLMMIALIIIGLHASRNRREIDLGDQHFIRRHARHGAAYYADPIDADDDPTVVMPLRRTHWALVNDMWKDSDHPVDAPTTGRHALENPARTIVPADWHPPVGRMRIALLSTMTSEYMLVRRPLELTSR